MDSPMTSASPAAAAKTDRPVQNGLARILGSRWLKLGAYMALAAAIVGIGAAIALNRPLTVPVANPERNVPIRVFGLGTVEARVLSKVGFEVGATLIELRADHGDRVKQGQVLARLASNEQEAKLTKARAALEIANANIRRAEANREKATAVLAQKLEANRRKQSLVGRDIVSQQTAEEAVRDEAVARADLAVAESEIATVKAQLSDAAAQVNFEETLLSHRTLLAPYDAIAIERHKELGSVVKAGDPIFTLIAVDSYWGLAYVDEARAGHLAEGQVVEARLRSRPDETFHGKVVRIGLESDRVTEERRVYLRGDKPPPRVFLGEQVEFWINVATLDTALLVPEAAVHGFDGAQGTVWTIENGRLQQRIVKFRHRTEHGRLEILSGVPANASVVTRTDASFRVGRAARIATDAKP